jgi:hypothetical protein
MFVSPSATSLGCTPLPIKKSSTGLSRRSANKSPNCWRGMNARTAAMAWAFVAATTDQNQPMTLST